MSRRLARWTWMGLIISQILQGSSTVDFFRPCSTHINLMSTRKYIYPGAFGTLRSMAWAHSFYYLFCHCIWHFGQACPRRATLTRKTLLNTWYVMSTKNVVDLQKYFQLYRGRSRYYPGDGRGLVLNGQRLWWNTSNRRLLACRHWCLMTMEDDLRRSLPVLCATIDGLVQNISKAMKEQSSVMKKDFEDYFQKKNFKHEIILFDKFSIGYYRAAWDWKLTASYDSVRLTLHLDAITVVVKAKVLESSQHVMTVDTTSVDCVLTLELLALVWHNVQRLYVAIRETSYWRHQRSLSLEIGQREDHTGEVVSITKCQEDAQRMEINHKENHK